MNEILSDKIQTGLFAAYESLFANLRNEPIKYLEMGVLNGGSLRWAKNYFCEGSQIYGLDRSLPQAIDGVVMQQIEQNDSAGLVDFGRLNGQFDIIIDDGSHVRALTENTFNCLYQYLKPGGFYIIEDWGAGYFTQWSHCKGMETLVTDLVWKLGGSVIRLKTGATYAIIEKNNI
jgi:hypothetical protein